MSLSSFKQDLESRLYGDIWGVTTPHEAAAVLTSVYGLKAITEAFKREHEALIQKDVARTIFWVQVQEQLNPYPVKLLH